MLLMLQCNKCNAFVFGAGNVNGGPPDSQLTCGCCPEDHDHAGLGCRPITITVAGSKV
jgi:hypothetical protein